MDNEYRTASSGGAPLLGVFVRLVEPTAGANHSSLVRIYEEAFQRDAQVVRAVFFSPRWGHRPPCWYLPGCGTRPASPPCRVCRLQCSRGRCRIGHLRSSAPGARGLGTAGRDRFLVEEPEAHQHPAVIAQAAKVLLGAARRGVQIMASTHSLELIDALVANADAADLESSPSSGWCSTRACYEARGSRAPWSRRGADLDRRGPSMTPPESVVICEGYHDRAFLNAWLLALGCTAYKDTIIRRLGRR